LNQTAGFNLGQQTGQHRAETDGGQGVLLLLSHHYPLSTLFLSHYCSV